MKAIFIAVVVALASAEEANKNAKPHLIGGAHDYFINVPKDADAHDKTMLGGDDHDVKPHGQPLLGGDDHDVKPHGQPLLGGGDHDLRPHGRPLLGQDGHGQRQVLGGGDHDMKPHGRPLLGQDGHGQRQVLGGGDHDLKPHGRPLLGQNGHGQRQVLGGGDHDLKPHGRPLLGQDGHGQRVLGGGDHDRKPHGHPLLGADNHDKQVHGKQRGANKKQHKKSKKVIGGQHDLKAMVHFKNFVKKHKKDYGSTKEYKKRYNIFRQNMAKASMLQENERGSAKYGVTKFADLTEEEFKRLAGFRPDLKPQATQLGAAEIPAVQDLPASFDWRDHGAVTEVKNQGQCGSCWAFSTTGNVEGAWAIKHGQLISLSEQELVDCDSVDQGCNGGLPENAYKVIQDMGGLETEDDYPYDGADENCSFKKELVKVTVNGSVELPEDETSMAHWLVQNGPISIGINANALQFYVGGVSHPLRFLCNPKGLDHGMLIVGYGVHTTKYLKKKQPYWIVKNSWGTDWGEKGYYRVYRGDGTCGLNKMATSAIVP